MTPGLRGASGNPASPPYSNGPYVWTFSNSSTSASSSFEPLLFSTTMTGIAGVGGRMRAFMTTNVALGSWSNAFKAEVTYGASGKTAGLGSALVAEMTLSAGTVDGNYAPLEIELNLGSGASTGTKTALQYMSVNGADASTFDTNGYIMSIQGLSEGTGKVFSAGADVAAAATLRILIGSTDYYILLATGESN